MDFPGLDDTTDKDGNNSSMVPVIEAIENIHVDGLLFVIDNSLHSGVNGSTVSKINDIMLFWIKDISQICWNVVQWDNCNK